MSDRLAELRAEMDRLNRELASLLQRRARLVRRIGAHKARLGLPAVDRRREGEMLAAAAKAKTRGFEPAALRRIFAAIFRESRRLIS